MNRLTAAPRLAAALLAAACLGFAAAPAASAQDFERWAAHDEDSGLMIDYQAFDDILGGIVYEVGRSDRQPARGRQIRTGTRISLESNSRYRYEANRVVYHALNDEQKSVISAYRAELERLPSQIDFARLPRNEQLAYWLNLHNLVVIDEIAKAYPTRRIDNLRVGPDREKLHDAKIIEIDGERLSLNDIRFEIVGRYWADPRVIYGFHSGAIGGPTLQGESYTGFRVWSQLGAGAREFVNALRGVDEYGSNWSVSPLYDEWREVFFESWPSDLRTHLRFFAESEVQGLLSIPDAPEFLRYDWNIADITNGLGACQGQSRWNIVTSSGESVVPQIGCNQLPAHSVELVETVIERRLEFLRQGRLGSVTVRDIPTDGEGNILGEDGRPIRRITPEGEELPPAGAGGDTND